MANGIALLKLTALLSILIMFGSVFYIRRLAKQKGLWREFLYSFSGNYRFYREHWNEVKTPLFFMLLAVLMLVFATWLLMRLNATPGLL